MQQALAWLLKGVACGRVDRLSLVGLGWGCQGDEVCKAWQVLCCGAASQGCMALYSRRLVLLWLGSRLAISWAAQQHTQHAWLRLHWSHHRDAVAESICNGPTSVASLHGTPRRRALIHAVLACSE